MLREYFYRCLPIAIAMVYLVKKIHNNLQIKYFYRYICVFAYFLIVSDIVQLQIIPHKRNKLKPNVCPPNITQFLIVGVGS